MTYKEALKNLIAQILGLTTVNAGVEALIAHQQEQIANLTEQLDAVNEKLKQVLDNNPELTVSDDDSKTLADIANQLDGISAEAKAINEACAKHSQDIASAVAEVPEPVDKVETEEKTSAVSA